VNRKTDRQTLDEQTEVKRR